MNETATSTVLSGSVESISSSRLLGSATDAKRGASQISRSYKQASNFFLQRRFPEALLTIQPLITSQSSSTRGDHVVSPRAAPVYGASRSNRVKVWSLYLTLLNAIIELGPDDGKNLFGSTVWRGLMSKIRDGSIWEEVVQVGYGGDEGSVDAEVVSNLATLLITHSPTQTTTQQRLETYLSASNAPKLDLSGRFENGITGDPDLKRRGSGTDTPRDLNSRIKVIELYTLHVLPRNEQWDYAKEFISMSEFLDDDAREEFLQTLQSLEDQKHIDAEREADIAREQEAEIQRQRQEADRRAAEELELERYRQESAVRASSHTRTDSEKDYGIEDTGPSSRRRSTASTKARPIHTQRAKKVPGKALTGGLYGRGVDFVMTLRQFIMHMTKSLSQSPAITLRLLLFIVALLAVMGRRDIRQGLGRITGATWDKLKRTAGMGVKVSYI